MKPLGRFLYWIKERVKIYNRKEIFHEPAPWTDDEVLKTYFFTNPYREWDRVTVWFKDNIREPLRDYEEVMFATIAFRWFTKPETGALLDEHGLFMRWDEKLAVSLLRELNEEGPVFTGAYMIKAGNGERGCKIPNVCSAISEAWRRQQEFIDACYETRTLQGVWEKLKTLQFMGKFMSYEVVTDLRHTALLEDAEDILTWANPGPGCIRGLCRMAGKPLGLTPKGKLKRAASIDNPQARIHELMEIVNERLYPDYIPDPFEMREAEHSLCEWDKYERALWEDGGRMKRKYHYVGN